MTKKEKATLTSIARRVCVTHGIKARISDIVLLEAGYRDENPDYLMFEVGEVEYQASKTFSWESKDGWELSRYTPEKKPFTVLLKTFTGMIIGEYSGDRVNTVNPKYIQVSCKSGKVLAFDRETGKEFNPKNPVFANSIEVVA